MSLGNTFQRLRSGYTNTFCININKHLLTIPLNKAMAPSDGKNKIDVRELHEAYQVVTVHLRSK